MARVEQREVKSKRKKISVIRKMFINDIGRWTTDNSQVIWQRFSVLVHPKRAAAQAS